MNWLTEQMVESALDYAQNNLTQADYIGIAMRAIARATKWLEAETKKLQAQTPVNLPHVHPTVAPVKTVEEARASAASAPGTLEAHYEDMFRTAVLNTHMVPYAQSVAHKIMNSKPRYLAIQKLSGVPWFFIGLLHERESSCNFATYLGNGQPLSQRTTIVPVGRGPFKTFEAGALDALERMGYTKVKVWTLGKVLRLCELFNGDGYRLYHHIYSPYVWSGTQYYVRGKYVKDGVFNANVVDSQLGTALILKEMLVFDPKVLTAV